MSEPKTLDADLILPGMRFPCHHCGAMRQRLYPVMLGPVTMVKVCKSCRKTVATEAALSRKVLERKP